MYLGDVTFVFSFFCFSVAFSLHEVTMPFAKVLPVVDGVISRLLCDAPNPFVQVRQGAYLEVLMEGGSLLDPCLQRRSLNEMKSD